MLSRFRTLCVLAVLCTASLWAHAELPYSAKLAYIIEGVTMVPVKTLLNDTATFGRAPQIEYVPGTHSYRIVDADRELTITFAPNVTTAKVGAKEVTLNRAPFNLHGIVYAPMTFLTDALGMTYTVYPKRTLVSIIYAPEKKQFILLQNGKEDVPPTASFLTCDLTAAAMAQRLKPVRKELAIAIFRAAAHGNTEAANKLLAANPELLYAVNSIDDMPIHMAARAGQCEMITLLVSKGASVHDRGNNGTTPLHSACSGGMMVLSSNDRHNDVSIDSYLTPEPEQMHKTVSLLLAKGANINAINSEGKTPLHLALGPFDCDAELVQLLLAKGADTSIADFTGRIPLFEAAIANSLNGLKALVANGVKLTVTDAKGETLLHAAAARGREEAIPFLVKHGVDINAKDNKGNTPLYHALHGFSDSGTLNALIAQGADVNAKNADGQTPLATIVHIQGSETPKLMQFLIEQKADVNATDNAGDTVFHHALNSYNPEVIKLLVQAGANINAKNADGQTPLASIVHIRGSVTTELMQILIEQKADVNATDNAGDTVLHRALRSYDLEVIKLLVQAGANLNAKNADGETPYALAKQHGMNAIMEYLASKGAK